MADTVQRTQRRLANAAYAEAHPELLPKPSALPKWRRCGLTVAGRRGGRATGCNRRIGHEGAHKNRDVAWSMMCPCPAARTKIYVPEEGRVFPPCAWCGRVPTAEEQAR